jgi:hypothetical protein
MNEQNQLERQKFPGPFKKFFVCVLIFFLSMAVPLAIVLSASWLYTGNFDLSDIGGLAYIILALVILMSSFFYWVNSYCITTMSEQMEKHSLIRAIEEASKDYPRLRLGQLLSNALDSKQEGPLYYVPDKQLKQAISDYMARLEREQNEHDQKVA